MSFMGLHRLLKELQWRFKDFKSVAYDFKGGLWGSIGFPYTNATFLEIKINRYE